MKKRQNKLTKSFIKSFKSIDNFIDLKEITNDTMILKDGSIIKGIKIMPFDIWTADDAQARLAILNLNQTLNKINFTVYQAFVFSPYSFDTAINSLARKIQDENITEIQRELIENDIEKLQQFSAFNQQVEFFVMIKEKNVKKLMRNYQLLISELNRFFQVKELLFHDYINYISWLFDISDHMITMGYFHERDYAENNSRLTDKEINKMLKNIKETIPTEHGKEIPVLYDLFDIRENVRDFEINGRYYSSVLVYGFPKEFRVGILNQLAKRADIKTFVMTETSNIDLISHVQKDSRDLQERYNKALKDKDEITAEKLKNEVVSLKNFANSITANHDKTLDMSLMFVITNENKEELLHQREEFVQTLRKGGFNVFIPQKLQLAMLKHFNPIFTSDKSLTNNLAFNIGFPMATSAIAKTYPYHFAKNEDPRGFLYGFETGMNGPIIFDPFFYLNNTSIADQVNRLSGNILLLGETGSGKSTDLYLMWRYCIREGLFNIWLDPENKNKTAVREMGGEYFEFGGKDCVYNLFQLTRVSTDEEDKKLQREIMWDTSMAIVHAVDRFKIVLSLYHPNISDNTLSIIGMIANRMYEECGITSHPTFQHLKNEDFPTLSDFTLTLVKVLKEFKDMGNKAYQSSCEDLLLKLTPLNEEHSYIFNGHTSIDITPAPKKIIGIGTKYLYTMPNNVKSALQYIICDMVFSYCLDDNFRSALIIDEAHTMFDNHYIVSLLDQLVRRNRKYYNLTILSSQEPLDIDNDKQTLLNQTTYIIIKMITKNNSLQKLKSLIGLDDQTLFKISTFYKGDSYFICGNKIKYFMHTLITNKELDDKGNNYA